MDDSPPLVGLTVNWVPVAPPDDACYGRWAYRLNGSYASLIESAGGVPVAILPSGRTFPSGRERGLDMVVLTGGGDPDPDLYGRTPDGCVAPERERPLWEMEVCRGCMSEGIPLLGICLGMQIIGIVSGAALVQDLPRGPGGRSIHAGTPAEPLSHVVETSEGTIVGSSLGRTCVVSSFHHQALESVPAGFVLSASAPDGVIEAVESRDPLVLGVQWHPERDSTGIALVRTMLRRSAGGR